MKTRQAQAVLPCVALKKPETKKDTTKKPRAKRLKLRGPLEQDLQVWILASLGAEQFELRKDKNQRVFRVSLNTWIGDGGKVCVHRNNTGAYRTPNGGFIRFGLGPGGADIVGVAYGVAVALEIKREGEHQTAEQKRWQADWERAGGRYAIVRCPSEAQAVVDEIRRRVAA